MVFFFFCYLFSSFVFFFLSYIVGWLNIKWYRKCCPFDQIIFYYTFHSNCHQLHPSTRFQISKLLNKKYLKPLIIIKRRRKEKFWTKLTESKNAYERLIHRRLAQGGPRDQQSHHQPMTPGDIARYNVARPRPACNFICRDPIGWIYTVGRWKYVVETDKMVAGIIRASCRRHNRAEKTFRLPQTAITLFLASLSVIIYRPILNDGHVRAVRRGSRCIQYYSLYYRQRYDP